MADEDAFAPPYDGHTPPETKKLFEILVPCNWNDGRPVRTRHHKEWDKRVRKIAGGLTILRPGKGQWVHENELYEDRVIPVRVFCTQSEIDVVAQITIQHYEQEAVMYYPIANWAVVHSASEAQRKKFTRKRNSLPKEVADAYNQ